MKRNTSMAPKTGRKKKELLTIGRTDFIDLPEVGIKRLPCKIDTGADSCSIHCDEIMVRRIDGVNCLVYKLLDKHHPFYTGEEIVTPNFSEKRVRSSFGETAERFQVRLKVVIFGRTYITNFNLSHRPGLRYPVLLGRKFLRNRFVVDVSQKDLNQI